MTFGDISGWDVCTVARDDTMGRDLSQDRRCLVEWTRVVGVVGFAVVLLGMLPSGEDRNNWVKGL